MERRKIAWRIELERVAIVGVQLADTVATGETNSHRPRYRFTRPNATIASRSRSRHLHDQSSAADRSRSGVVAAPLCDARTRPKGPRPPILLNSCAFRVLASASSRSRTFLSLTNNDRDYDFAVSASEIIKELPKLSEAERRAIREGLLEIANQDSDVALCNRAALDGALMLDRMEEEYT